MKNLKRKYDKVYYTNFIHSEFIKDILLKTKWENCDINTFSLMYLMGLSNTYYREIVPKLKEEYIVVLDRYIYTIISKNIVSSEVKNDKWINKCLEIFRRPDIKIFIDTSIDECLKRKNHEDKIILFLGFITELKGVFDIPDIAKKIIERNRNVKFVLAGSGEIEKLQAIVEEKGISQYFSFPGWVKKERKEKLLQEADLFFLPSYTEGMPMSILEAMGYGLPIVATNVGGIPQLVENGKNGYMVEPGKIDDFAKVILELTGNDELIYRMGKESIEKAYEKYSLEKHLEKVCKLYEKSMDE